MAAAKYPEGLTDWNLQPFPVELKNKIIGVAKYKGVTTPVLLEQICTEWLATNVNVKDDHEKA